MNKIKQMLCIALTFVILGGCAQVKKTDKTDETTFAESVQTLGETHESETDIPSTSETEQVTTSLHAETTNRKTKDHRKANGNTDGSKGCYNKADLDKGCGNNRKSRNNKSNNEGDNNKSNNTAFNNRRTRNP